MVSLARRVAALEALTPDLERLTIVRFIAAHGDAREPSGFRSLDGAQRWERDSSESVDELFGRVEREVKRNAWGVAIVVENK